MNDLISRQTAIDVMKKHRTIFCDNRPESFRKLPYSDKCRVDEIDNCIAELVNIPTVHQWIPCFERLPEDRELKWLTFMNREKNDTCIGFYSREEGCWCEPTYGYAYADRIIAWMPIVSPEPYKGEEK